MGFAIGGSDEVTVWLCASPTLVYYWAVYPCISQKMGWCKMTPKWLRGWCKMLGFLTPKWLRGWCKMLFFYFYFILLWPPKTSNTIFLRMLYFLSLGGCPTTGSIRIPITSPGIPTRCEAVSPLKPKRPSHAWMQQPRCWRPCLTLGFSNLLLSFW